MDLKGLQKLKEENMDKFNDRHTAVVKNEQLKKERDILVNKKSDEFISELEEILNLFSIFSLTINSPEEPKVRLQFICFHNSITQIKVFVLFNENVIYDNPKWTDNVWKEYIAFNKNKLLDVCSEEAAEMFKQSVDVSNIIEANESLQYEIEQLKNQ